MACGQKSLSPAQNQLVVQEGFPSAVTDTLAKYLVRMPNGTQVACVRIMDSVPYFYSVLQEKNQLKTIDNPTAAYEIGSISKVMTAILLAQQIHNNRIKPEESINSYLPFTLKDGVQLTFRQLANHTSGLPRVPDDMVQDIIFNRSNPYKNYDTTRLRKYLSEKLELEATPGVEFGYSNLGAGLLGLTLEYLTNTSYEEQLQQIIFQTYGIEQSTTDRSRVSTLVQGLNANGKTAINGDLAAMVRAGAVLSSAEDLSQFALAQFNPQDAVIVLSNCSAFSDQSPQIDALGQALLPTASRLYAK